jgi:hypothetical protein
MISLEEKYLLPFLKRTTEFGSASPRAGAAHGHGHGAKHAAGEGAGEIEASTGMSGSAFNSDNYIANEHIDGLFGFGGRDPDESGAGNETAQANAV